MLNKPKLFFNLGFCYYICICINRKIIKMKPYTDKTDKVDDRKCLYGEIKANDISRKKAARRKAKKDIEICLHDWDEGYHNVSKCKKCGKYSC